MKVNHIRKAIILWGLAIILYAGNSCRNSGTNSRGSQRADMQIVNINFKDVKQATLEEIMADAVATEKLVFIDFYTTWCGPCKWMDSNVFNQNDVATKLNRHFINYKVDAEDFDGVNTALKYRVNGYPTFVFLTPQGKVIHTLEGMIPKETFMQTIDELVLQHKP